MSAAKSGNLNTKSAGQQFKYSSAAKPNSIMKLFFLIALLSFVNTVSSESNAVTVTYVANEGVLIQSGSKQVLIDALHKPYLSEYLATPQKILHTMMANRPPFEDIELLLVSHIHGDHFNAELVGEYLQVSKTTRLFTTLQAKSEIAKNFSGFANITDKTQVIRYHAEMDTSFSVKGIQVRMVRIAHGGGRGSAMQNVGHIVELGGLKFLHIGDPSYGKIDFERLQLFRDKIDVAILPFWFLTAAKGREIIDQLIKPAYLIAVHVPPKDVNSITREIAKYYPEAVVFGKPNEQQHYNNDID